MAATPTACSAAPWLMSSHIAASHGAFRRARCQPSDAMCARVCRMPLLAALALQLSSVQFHLITTTILLISREGFRRWALCNLWWWCGVGWIEVGTYAGTCCL